MKNFLSRALSVILITVMLVPLITSSGLTVYAESHYGTCGEDLGWYFDSSTGTLYISGTGEMDNHSAGYYPWNNYTKYITTISIDDSVTYIGDNAFHGCANLKSVTIGDSVTSIGEDAFVYCTSLESVHITDIASWCNINFCSLSSNPLAVDVDRVIKLYVNGLRVNDLVIPDSVKNISPSAFVRCAINSVTIGDSVTSIGIGAFQYCTALKSVSLGNSLETIGHNAFFDCKNLEKVIIPDSVTSIGEGAFAFCSSLEMITIPDSVTSIGLGAFSYSLNLVIDCSKDSYAGRYARVYDISAVYHSFTDYTYNNDETCTEDGTKTAYCDYGCGTKDTVIIENSAIGHSFTNYVSNKDGTCTEDGTMTAYCDNGCGTTDTVTEKDSKLHDYVCSVIREATCTKTGLSMYMCSLCNDYYTEELPTKDHVFTDYKYNDDATCMGDGTKTAYCNNGCGVTDTVTAEGTAVSCLFTEYKYNGDATCTADGTMTAFCDYGCGKSVTLTAPDTKTEHNYVADVLEEASCVTPGTAIFMCSCKDYYIGTIPALGHKWGEWIVVTEPTFTTEGESKRICGACGNVDIAVTDKISPEITTDNYIITITYADQIKDLRYAPGEYTTTTEIRNAEGNVAISNALVQKHTVDGKFVYEMPKGGYYTIWVRMVDGTSFILPLDVTKFTPTVTSDGVTVTIHDLYNVKDFFIAKGEYGTYREIKDNGYIFNATGAKIGDKHNYTHVVYEPGVHTVLIRYNDGTQAVFHETLTVDEPTLIANGLQLTVGNIPGVKVIRTAYGEFNTPGEVKRAEGARNFSNKTVIKNAEEYMIQYREEGTVTVTVEYTNGYVKVFHHNIEKKTPTVERNGNTVSFGELDGLVTLRYAKGEFATVGEIKRAEGSKALKPADIVDGKISVTLKKGTYTFCVQYNDESYNYYTITVE